MQILISKRLRIQRKPLLYLKLPEYSGGLLIGYPIGLIYEFIIFLNASAFCQIHKKKAFDQ